MPNLPLRQRRIATSICGGASAPVLITGGAGFIGTNVADRLLAMGRRVVVLDNLSRPGVDQNALWLQRRYGSRVKIVVGDVRDRKDIRRALEGVGHVFHFAAQVAVTTSLLDPRADFETNAGGTMNLLDEMRAMSAPPSIIYTSTNKVYGDLRGLALRVEGNRYAPVDGEVARNGIDETRPLDFHTPYGCSKGAAEQYVLDHARTMGLRGVVFRMSCVYGPHQFGNEDQGWVAHFLIRALERKPITVYGDGLQVRDLLFVQDLVDALLLASSNIGELSGCAYNIGGGVERAVSLLELIELVGSFSGAPPDVLFDRCRVGDQSYYVSNISKFRSTTKWEPRVPLRAGIRHLYDWLVDSRSFEVEALAAT
jgi:CDP-paratose 2-epimerase